MTQKAIGLVHYQPPRAVGVRDDAGMPHDSIYGTFAVYVDQKTHADAVMANWDDLMAQINTHVQSYLPPPEPVEPAVAEPVPEAAPST